MLMREIMEDGTFIESYKISTRGRLFRRETSGGANALAEKLHSQGKHGTVEAIICKKGEGLVEIKLVRTF